MKVICSSKIDSYVAHVFLHNKPIDFSYSFPFLLDMNKIVKFIRMKTCEQKRFRNKISFLQFKISKTSIRENDFFALILLYFFLEFFLMLRDFHFQQWFIDYKLKKV
jgi:hypothetical protein